MGRQLRNFFVQAYLNYRGLFYWLNWSGYLSSIIVFPIMTVTVYVLLGRFMIDSAAAERFALGASVSSIAFVIIGGITQTYSRDRDLFTMSFVFITPVNRLLHSLSRSVFHLPNGIVTVTCSMVAIWALTDVEFSQVNWGGFILSMLVITGSLCAFTQFLGIFVMVTRNWMMTLSISLGLVMVMSGIYIPLEYFPIPVQELAKLLPVTNGLDVYRMTFAGASLGDTGLLLLREGITGMAYLAISAIGFVVFERIAKRTGIMETEPGV